MKSKFSEIGRYLKVHSEYWQLSAFHFLESPWKAQHLGLCDYLSQLSLQQVELGLANPSSLYDEIKGFLPQLLPLDHALFDLPEEQTRDDRYPFWLATGVKGRKWQQITRFAAQIDTKQNEILEWCAGKGHLGRVLGWQSQQSVTSVEWQQSLCEQGDQLAEKHKVQQHFYQADVLANEADQLIKPDGQHIVALHACGDLHVKLIELARQYRPQQLSLSPCCYHLTKDIPYQGISRAAKNSQLKLSQNDLKLAMAEQVTSGKRQSRLREREVSWRLSLDSLLRSLTGEERYHPLPGFPKALLSGDFREFVLWALDNRGIKACIPEDLSFYIESGQQRYALVRRIELIRQYFRRPLELWLAYDRACALEEAGYQVCLSQFCEHKVTPRNLLINASL